MNKEELISFAESEFDRLLNLIAKLSDEQRDKEFVYENRTTKDIVAHLYSWHLLELNWYKTGMKGDKPEIPAPGFTFKDTPALNEKLYQEYMDIKWKDLMEKFSESHKQLLEIIKSHTQDELFTKKKYAWTGSTDMAIYFRGALSSHYVWAIDLIRKHFKIKI